MALMSCQNVSLGYAGTVVAQQVTFAVHSGDYLCIVGENGSGKSTLMKTCLGLIPPLAGSFALGDGLHHREIGYLPQQTQIKKDFPATCWEIVLSGCLNRCGLRPFYNHRDKQLAKLNMDKMGISSLCQKPYCALSGGQQQRVLLARALCAAHKLLLLDEPVAGLDPKVTKEMYAIIRRLNREGITIIMISHDIEAALEDATHILHMGDQPLFYGKKEDYLHFLHTKEGGARL